MFEMIIGLNITTPPFKKESSRFNMVLNCNAGLSLDSVEVRVIYDFLSDGLVDVPCSLGMEGIMRLKLNLGIR